MTYDREEACRAWLACGHFFRGALDRLMDDFDGSAEDVYAKAVGGDRAFLLDYMPQESVPPLMAQAGKEAMHSMLVTMQANDMRILFRDDPQYPQQLLEIHHPPVFLFYQGNIDVLSRRCVTFVGTRHPTMLAEQTTEELAAELSRRGVTIVSGMAQGIDRASHRGCIRGGSPTVGVMACGLDVTPYGTKVLRKELLEGGGLLLSEYPPGEAALAWHYPVRNRILSGLGKGVVMMECGIRSGTMLTVNHATDQGRDVFVWPGIPGSEAAEGAHMLIREGAIYFTSAEDLLEDLKWEDLGAQKKQEGPPLSQLAPDQREICGILRTGDKTLDELAFATGMETPALSGALTLLELLGYIRSLPGKTYHMI